MDEYADRLSDYLDDELDAGERQALEAHLAGCAECTRTLEELRLVVDRARELGPRPPARDLWSGIEPHVARPASLRPFRPRAPRRFSFTLPELAAAAVLVAAVSGAVALRVATLRQPPPAPAQTATVAPAAASDIDARAVAPAPGVAQVSYADAQYDAAVADLEKALETGRGRLDKSTIAAIEQSLQTIDQAIDQARQALESDPANSYLSGHLVEARRRKLELLRRAAALTETN